MKPFYKDDAVTLYHGDAREVLPRLRGRWDSCITDPVWPNALMTLQGSDDPAALLKNVMRRIARRVDRAVIIVGANSDPRFLDGVPLSMPFLRTLYMRYARPSYVGRYLNGAEVGYTFGEWPPVKPGAFVLPGEMMYTGNAPRYDGHPCPRRIEFMRWVCSFWGVGHVIDPFAGGGTTGLACAELGLKATLIEVEGEFCERTALRLSNRQGFLC